MLKGDPQLELLAFRDGADPDDLAIRPDRLLAGEEDHLDVQFGADWDQRGADTAGAARAEVFGEDFEEMTVRRRHPCWPVGSEALVSPLLRDHPW